MNTIYCFGNKQVTKCDQLQIETKKSNNPFCNKYKEYLSWYAAKKLASKCEMCKKEKEK